MQEDNRKLNALFTPLEDSQPFTELARALESTGVCSAYGPDETQRAHIFAAAALKTGRPMLVIEPNDVAAQHMMENMNLLLDGTARYLPPRDVTFLKTAASSRELIMQRLDALGDCRTGEVRALVLSAETLLFRMADPKRFDRQTIELKEGDVSEPSALIEKLVEAGYERVQMVEARGQCALRGGILDVYPIGGANALRFEFFDDEIDSIRSFDIMTQRSISRRPEVRLYPAQEVLLTREEAEEAAARLEKRLDAAEKSGSAKKEKKSIEQEYGLSPFDEFMQHIYAEEMPKKNEKIVTASALRRKFGGTLDALRTGRTVEAADALLPVLMEYNHTVIDYLDDPILVFDQPERLRERAENRVQEFAEQFSAARERSEAIGAQSDLLLTYDEIIVRAEGKRVLTINPFMRTDKDFRPKALISFECRNATGYQSNLKELARDIRHWQSEGWRVALLSGGTARGERLEDALAKLDCPVPFSAELPETLEPGQPVIFPVTLNKGFLYPDIRFAIISESDIYGVNRQKSRSKAKPGEKIAAFTELKVGDYVVHENHGVGQYMGTIRLSSEGTYRDFLNIRYQGADKLYVPVDQLDRIQKYIGSEENPKINSLSGGDWQRAKAKVKKSIQQIAGDLLKLYAQRESQPGFAFEPDTPWQREFEDNFPFEETPDQLNAIAEIKEDMEKPRSMDRLLCGDVGYGKTEVALRAIFKCVLGGKQAVMLAPTTILVQQHYATMINRFAGFPIRVESLSRFKTAAEQRKIVEQLAEGSLDVVVGTHRLLAKDVKFKDLGLLVVDEEQRFGVTHKEAIKRLKKNVDVLTLTATPIPRTLHMSMVGIRDMSLLQSPPENRFPVQTYVVEYSDGLIRDAIMRELARGGQVYVLHNRVQSIDFMYDRLKKLVPEARIAVGHGQMREHALEDVMMDFYEGKFDVLLCTTIIEAGLDVPRANTLIVCDADRFGLSQLYQLRGRVGRSNRLAYAYLTVSPNKVLTETADKRLAAIREFTEFGSGFRVAMRDLEIRGAGNLLGSEQSGFMASVGYDLYVKMIEQTVKELRGDVAVEDIETRIDIKLDAYLPQEYVADDLRRIEMYKKIASVRNNDMRDDVIEEFIDRFGDPTRPVMNLIDIAQLKAICGQLGIDYVYNKKDELLMRFCMSADIDFKRVLIAIHTQERYLTVRGTNPPAVVYYERDKTTEELLHGALKAMTAVLEAFNELAAEDSEKKEMT